LITTFICSSGTVQIFYKEKIKFKNYLCALPNIDDTGLSKTSMTWMLASLFVHLYRSNNNATSVLNLINKNWAKTS